MGPGGHTERFVFLPAQDLVVFQRSSFVLAAITGLLIAFAAVPVRAITEPLRVTVDTEAQMLRGMAGSFTLTVHDAEGAALADSMVAVTPTGTWEDTDGASIRSLAPLALDENGQVTIEDVVVRDHGGFEISFTGRADPISTKVRVLNPLWALLPPLLSIVLALWLRQVLLALTAGVLSGMLLMKGNPIAAFVAATQEIVVPSVTDSFQASILLFTVTLGGMVGVMARAGGTHGLVDAARKWIRDARSSQLATAMLGLVIFFDDYANTLLVGNTMRPVTDRMRVSREKLSYLVDSTAAPVATIAVLSTWVGYQVGLIGDGLDAIGSDASAYGVFVESIPYAAYSWFALALVFLSVGMRRDFGPMLSAERRARHEGKVLGPNARPLIDDVGADLEPAEGAPRRAHVALVPVLVVLVTTVLGLWFDGRRVLLEEGGPIGLAATNARDVFSSADPAAALFWAVLMGSAVAITLAVSEKLIDLPAAMEAWMSGAKAMVPALAILILAWSIGSVCEALRTADVVVGAATGNLSARLVPTVAFLVAAFLGFSTGTSWGTMAILMPIVIPLSTELAAVGGVGEAAATAIFLSSVACVLSGSVFGDHCSPISDTTIMSSMASGADHVDHVRTQFPYALLAGTLAVLLGTIPAGYGVSPWITLPIGVALVAIFVRFVGRDAESEPA